MKNAKYIIAIIILLVILFTMFLLYDSKKNDQVEKNKTQEVEKKEEEKKPEEKKEVPKKAIFFGDSITYGFLTRGYSYANYIGDNYGFQITNAGVSDYRLAYSDPNKWLVDEVTNHYNDDIEYAYVILEGGINDRLYNTPIGEMTDSFDASTFNKNTVIGGLELYLNAVKTKWPEAKIGYIITYYTPVYTERGIKWSVEDYKEYNDAIKKVLDKWSIKYFDLSTDEMSSKLDIYNTTYLPDHLHPNKAGYDLISPLIYEFMLTI